MASISKITACAAAMMIVVSFAGCCAEASIGINWGRESAQRLVPSQVVDLLLQNGIGRLRIFTGQEDVMKAVAGSGINLTISLISTQKIKSKRMAEKWVSDRYEYFNPANVQSVFFKDYPFWLGSRDKEYITFGLKVLRWVQEGLNEFGVGHVKANMIHFQGEMKQNVTKPSECEFLDEIKPEMAEFLRFLRENDAPFWADHVPLLDVVTQNISVEFAYPDNANVTIHDVGGAVYTNIVAWRYDCYLWALKKLNASDIKVHFSVMGWPTDGFPEATAANAERFFRGLLPWVTGNKGTPMRPGLPIDVNLHELADEHMMSTLPFTRHMGIYRSNGSPKYKIDLTGKGRDIYPTTVKGIMHMPNRWCVYNGDSRDTDKVDREFKSACNMSDCTSLVPGGSCSHLSFDQKVSYAFNMHFQFQFQDEAACDFGGLGLIVIYNPSTEECVFPVEVVKGMQVNYGPPSLDVNNAGGRPHPISAGFLVWLLIVGEILLLGSKKSVGLSHFWSTY